LKVKYNHANGNEELNVEKNEQFNEIDNLFADGKEYIAHPDSLQVSEKMFQERKHCDVIIDVKGEKMSVHRAVLACKFTCF